MNAGAARDELKARGFDYLSNGRALIMLNNAKNHLEDLADWPWLETTATGAAPLTISDLKQILYVVDTTNDRLLTEIDVRDIAGDVADTGTPSYWWLDGLTTLKVWPVQTASLSVRYAKYSPELSGDSDTPLIPTRYHPLWIDFAVMEAYKDSDNFQAQQALLPDLDRRVAAMIQAFVGRNHQGPSFQQLTYVAEDW